MDKALLATLPDPINLGWEGCSASKVRRFVLVQAVCILYIHGVHAYRAQAFGSFQLNQRPQRWSLECEVVSWHGYHKVECADAILMLHHSQQGRERLD